MKAVLNNDQAKYDAYIEAVDGDLSEDYIRNVYQYYLADRKEMMQDFTPSSMAKLVAMLAGDDKTIIDLCAGTGTLTVKKMLVGNPDFIIFEKDERVIPFLLFNLVIRNINTVVNVGDVLSDDQTKRYWIKAGERYGHVINQ